MDVALFGAAGYAGIELCKLLAEHPEARLVAAASDTHAGRPLAEVIGRPHPLTFVTTNDALATPCEAALLAVPPEPAKELAFALRDRAKIVDLSHAHRTDEVYGLTSLFAGHIGKARLVANPGCYATCAITALHPIMSKLDGVIAISAGSGVTGAGRTATVEMSLGEMYGEVRAYKVLRHQHMTEIERVLGARKRIVMTTHLLPVARGIFMTITAKLREPIGDAYEVYRNDPTVVLAATAEDVSLRKVVGTNTCMIGHASDGEVVVVTAALDNLLKGAAGQAIENMNLMFGYPRLAGLEHLARHA